MDTVTVELSEMSKFTGNTVMYPYDFVLADTSEGNTC